MSVMSDQLLSHKILLTVDILYTIFDNFTRQDDIHSVLTVHSVWTPILIKHLWKSPSWQSPKSFLCFIRTLQCPTPYFPYSTLIRNLSFTPICNRIPPSFTQKDMLFLSEVCTNLTHLTVSWMRDPFNSHVFSQFLINCPNLRSITAPSCTIEWLTNALNPIITDNSVKSLHHIEFKNWSYETQETAALLQKVSETCKSVKSISAPLLMTKDVSSIIISSFPQLEKFECISVTNDGLETLAIGLNHLKELTLTFDNEYKDVNDDNSHHYAKYFSRLEKFNLTIGYNSNFPKFFNEFSLNQRNLRELELIHCFGLEDNSFIPIAENCHSLESVKLKWCSLLTDESYIALAKERNQHLKALFVFRSGITDSGLTHISENCQNLEILDLENCKEITLNGLSKIVRNCKKLRKLKVELPESVSVGTVCEIIKRGINHHLEELKFRESSFKDPTENFDDETLIEGEDDDDDGDNNNNNNENRNVNNNNNKISSGNFVEDMVNGMVNNVNEILNGLGDFVNELSRIDIGNVISKNFGNSINSTNNNINNNNNNTNAITINNNTNTNTSNNTNTNIDIKLVKSFNGRLLKELSKSCPNLIKLTIKSGRIRNVTGDKLINILRGFKNLEKLCVIPPNLNEEHIKQLEKHPRLKEVFLIGGCTEGVERYIEKESRNGKIFVKVMRVYGFSHVLNYTNN